MKGLILLALLFIQLSLVHPVVLTASYPSNDYLIPEELYAQMISSTTIARTESTTIEEVIFTPVKKWAGVVVGLKVGDIIYTFHMWAGPMIYDVYLDIAIGEPLIINTQINEWVIYCIKYNATAPGREDDVVVEKSLLVAVRDNVALVSLNYRNRGDVTITLIQYPTHLHEGTDGIGGVTVYPLSARDVVEHGYFVDNPVETPNFDLIESIRELHEQTWLTINGVSEGIISELGRWRTLHYQSPGRIHIKHSVETLTGSMDFNLYVLNDAIQVITNNLFLYDIHVNNGILDIQHETETLDPGDKKSYYYIVSIGIELEEDNINKLMKYLSEINSYILLREDSKNNTPTSTFRQETIIEEMPTNVSRQETEFEESVEVTRYYEESFRERFNPLVLIVITLTIVMTLLVVIIVLHLSSRQK